MTPWAAAMAVRDERHPSGLGCTTPERIARALEQSVEREVARTAKWREEPTGGYGRVTAAWRRLEHINDMTRSAAGQLRIGVVDVLGDIELARLVADSRRSPDGGSEG